MAKEMMIVFVYDTHCLKDEADDPVNAVLYFHPSWVSDSQKLALCGQIMGTANFLRETFGKPKVIALQNGKFVLKEFGRFILAVGTDRNIALSILEHRAELLSSLVKLFHRDIQTIYDQFSTSGQFKNISEKLYHIFETYLPILQYNGNIFQNMPKSKLPKSASNIFLEAMHTLQSCQRTKGILGGSILYHNKIIASQLYSKLAKNLVLTDPYRIKSSTETITVNFHVPVGCQLITVFIPKKEYEKLHENSERIQNTSGQTYTNGNNNPVYPFQLKKKLKRDKSIVFTNIPEEGSSMGQEEPQGNKSGIFSDQERKKSSYEEQKNNSKPGTTTTASVRPNHLPLRFKNISAKDIPESGFSSSITFDERDSYPQFIGRTSVCSTPMTENKVLQGNILPICIDPLGKLFNEEDNNTKPEDLPNKFETQAEVHESRQNGSKFEFPEKSFENYIDKPNHDRMRRNSFVDIKDTMKKMSRHLSIRPISMGCAKFLNNSDYELSNRYSDLIHKCSENCNNFDYDADLIDDVDAKILYRTIADPTYPVFNSFGETISKFLFDEYSKAECKTNVSAILDSSSIDYEQPSGSGVVVASVSNTDKKPEAVQQPLVRPVMAGTSAKNNVNRKSLSLPIKSLDLNIETDKKATNDLNECLPANNTHSNILDRPEQRRKLTGIQLTPLITKLSILAMNDERSSGFSSWDTTPGVELATPLDSTKLFRRRSSVKLDDVDLIDVDANTNVTEIDENDMKRVELFICGQNNMTVLLLMEEGSAEKQELIQAMFDICVSKLPRLEAHLNQILNVNVNGDRIDGGYSYLNIDPHWDTLDRAGPWSNADLMSIESVRHEFDNNSDLHNFILRGDDSVIYGHQSIDSSVFYKQPAQFQNGLPPPADAMGTIFKHAKRQLERDHSLILF